MKELGLGLKFKAKGKLNDEARELMKAHEQPLLDHLVTEAYEAANKLKHRAEAGTTPITFDDLVLSVKVACNGDLAMKDYFVRWVNNPTLYKRKWLEQVELARKAQSHEGIA